MRPAIDARTEGGYTVIELLTVMIILGTILTGVLTLFASALRAETDLTIRHQAQSNARLALTKVRRDARSACGVAAGWTSSSVTLQSAADMSGTTCQNGANSITWCATGSGSNYGLYRAQATSCTGGVRFAEYLTSNVVFTYSAKNTPVGLFTLPRVNLDLQVNANPATPDQAYRLTDDVALRSGSRS
jgi:type II secretory pathway pseudopilin PulG